MRNIKLVIEYNGSRYHGWQKQRDKLTIQSVLEGAISKITSEKVKLIGAGRTDAGVHALRQVAIFKTDSSLSQEIFKRAINSLCPPDIRIISVEEVEPGFHPRFSAKAKSYLYFICVGDRPSVFVSEFCWPLLQGLNTEAMKEASQYIIGTHDFSAFRASGCASKTTVRSIFELTLEEKEVIPFLGIGLRGRFIQFRVCGNAFLRYMVRNIVGTLVEIGRGKRDPLSIKEVLQRGDRHLAGITAPAKGLFLEEIYY